MGDSIEALTITRATADDVPVAIEPLFREYGEWIAERLVEDAGVTLTDADLEQHHDDFRQQIPGALGPRGRVLLARTRAGDDVGDDDGGGGGGDDGGGGGGDGEPVGVGVLKPVDATTAEIKRMYVRPAARGLGVGRALLTGLVEAARAEGYRTVRLETLQFMTTAHALYRRFGFGDRPPFAGAEVESAGLEALTLFMELDLTG
ncbi:MAG TPA: GNAT family N-acetyltransferase [Acidimicrobiales bacterium]